MTIQVPSSHTNIYVFLHLNVLAFYFKKLFLLPPPPLLHVIHVLEVIQRTFFKTLYNTNFIVVKEQLCSIAVIFKVAI
jgi:hypothetical protein